MHRKGTNKAPQPAPANHSWISNPLDWVQIDRMVLLASIIVLIPSFFGGSLVLTLILAPAWLNLPVALGLLGLYGVYLILLIGFIFAALQRRKSRDHWGMFENFIVTSFVVVVLIQSWLSGTHFTAGMLLMMMGVYMASALADIRKIYIAYLAVTAVFVLFCIAEGSGRFRYAPLFTRPLYNPDGSFVTAWFYIQIIQIAALMLITRIGIMATQRWVERENLFREMSTIDGLTRLTNRRSFIERSQTEFARASRMPETGIACVMMDIDHFKKINDTMGHPAGDAVLIQTATFLNAQARSYDEVARYGGEEFAILLPATSIDDAEKIAERLRAGIAKQTIKVEGKKIQVTASFGVASFPSPGVHSMDDLLKAADDALYRAKYGGRNRVVATRKQKPGTAKPVKRGTGKSRR